MSAAIVLLNLGTPNSPKVGDIKKYLRQFLTDYRVVDLPWLIRQVLVNFFIIPFRKKQSAAAYLNIWSIHGSPLLMHSNNLRAQVQNILGNKAQVFVAMRYGKPDVREVIDQIYLGGFSEIIILPMFPQYSSAATGSAIEYATSYLNKFYTIPSFKIISYFYAHSSYIEAIARLIEDHAGEYEHILFSFHGLPQRQIMKSCNKELMCDKSCKNMDCYQAQCYATTNLVTKKLNIPTNRFSIAFQSRLGKIPWLQPYLLEHLAMLIDKGVTNITIICPGFTVDCLETIEEIGIQAKEYWYSIGGKGFKLVPCLNDNAFWATAILDIVGLSHLKKIF